MQRTNHLLKMAALLSILLGAACGSIATPTPTVLPIPSAVGLSGTLHVLDWGGFEVPTLWSDFQTIAPGVTITFELRDTNVGIYQRAKENSQLDIIHGYNAWEKVLVDDELIEEIDTSKLTNWNNIPREFQEAGRVNGKQYFVPWDWGYSSVLYRTDKIPEGITSWKDQFNSKYKGHIAVWDDGPANATVYAHIRGLTEAQLTDAMLPDMKAEWQKLRSLNPLYWTTEADLIKAMESGDIWLGYGWQGTYAQLLQKGVPVDFASLKEGRPVWVGLYGIRKGSPNKDLALRFLDAKDGPNNGISLVNNLFYGHANQIVMNAITDIRLRQAFSLDDVAAINARTFTLPITLAQQDSWSKLWEEVKNTPPAP